MDIFLEIIFAVLRVIRRIIDATTDVVFSWYYCGKKDRLPPIKNDLILQSASVLASKIRRREVSSIEVVKAYIERIHDVQPIVNAVVDERFSEAVEEAHAVDEFLRHTTKSEDEIQKDTPFLGVPITIKEAIAVKGCLFTVGLPARKGLRASSDSESVSLLKKSGAIPIAITITPELCFWWESYNTLYGCCKNPYDTTRTSGGSSGGEGCILGSAGSVIGLGNDIGGSIRIPASFNGIFGHKPSRGIVSNAGQYPTSAPALQAFLMTGPMCRYATDIKPLLKVLSTNHASRLKLNDQVNFQDLKIYYIEDDGGSPLVSAVNYEVIMAQRKVLKYFEDMYGVKAVKVKVPHMERGFEIWSKILTTSDMKPVAVEMTGRTGKANLLLESLKWMFGASDHILPVIVMGIMNKFFKPRSEKDAEKYYKMMLEMDQFFEELLKQDGIFICPTNPDFALHHHQAKFKSFNMTYTAIFNLVGLPVSQCPVGFSQDGLPIGLQIVAGMHCDHITIAVAEELERAFSGWVDPCKFYHM